jgi:hypothetical protein
VRVIDLHEFRLAREVEERPAVAVLVAKFVRDDVGEMVATLQLHTDPEHVPSPPAFAAQHFREVAALLLRLAEQAS